VVYYFSRFKKQFRTAIIINGFVSYLVLAINYYINSGINGPTLFLFFFTLHMLVSATPNRMHTLWLFLHGATITGIMLAEFAGNGIIKYTYRDNTARLVDEVASYIITILFIYQVTRYVRSYYSDEKTIADDRELKLKAFFDSSDSCHFLMDTHCRVTYFNNKAASFLATAYNKELRPGLSMPALVNPAYAKTFTQNCADALAGKTIHEERRFVYGGIGTIWWHITFMPVWDSAKNIIGVSYNAADVTAVREQEENLRLKNESLLKIAYIQTHELWQPVTSIIGLMNLIEDDPENMQQYLKLVESATLELDDKIVEIVAQTKGASSGL